MPSAVPAPDFWKLFSRKKVNTPALTAGYLVKCILFYVHWVEREKISDGHRPMQDELVQPGEYNVYVKRGWNCRRGGADVLDITELKGHLIIWRENLFITYVKRLASGCKANAFIRYKCLTYKEATQVSHMRKLMSMADYPDPEGAKHKDRDKPLFSLGYCYDYIKGSSSLHSLKKAHTRTLASSFRFNPIYFNQELLGVSLQPNFAARSGLQSTSRCRQSRRGDEFEERY
jgi:hypothetical protein